MNPRPNIPTARNPAILIATLGLVLCVSVTAQSFTTLHNFSAISGLTNSDGANPFAGLISAGDILYGTSSAGGGSGNGTVFALRSDGSSFAVLHNFTGLDEGASPRARLVLWGTFRNDNSRRELKFRFSVRSPYRWHRFHHASSFYRPHRRRLPVCRFSGDRGYVVRNHSRRRWFWQWDSIRGEY